MNRTTAAKRIDDDREIWLEPAVRPKADAARKRACLSCSQPFESEGWHHRLCPKCRKRSD